MTSTTSKRSLKRLSLLQSSPSTSVTTDARESPESSYRGADEAGPSSAPLPAQRSPRSADSDFSTPDRGINENPKDFSTSLKNTRRQSTICYFSPDRESSPLASPSLCTSRRLSDQHVQAEDADAQRKLAEKRKKERRRASVQVLQRPPRSGEGESHHQDPLTLAERHADLLRFIAQKESKCLELRQQLAVHEAELAQLKRTWTRIVTRGITSSSAFGSPPLSLNAPIAGLHSAENLEDVSLFSVSAIRESVQGVGRLLAQLGDIGVQGLPLEALHHLPPSSSEAAENDETARKMTSRTHAPNASISASSASSSSFASSTRLSQSSLSLSLSSIGESLPDDEPSSLEDKIRSSHNASDEAIVEDAPNASRSHDAKTTNSGRSNAEPRANNHSMAIPSPLHESRPIRRKPYESSSPSESTDSLSPMTPNSAPPLARSFSLNSNSSVGHRVRPTPLQTQKQRRFPATGPNPRTAGANFPAPASMPGLNAFATVSAIPMQPFSALIDSVGRKFGQLQLHAQAQTSPSAAAASPTASGSMSGSGSRSGAGMGASVPTSASKFTTAVHKRASTLLSGASNSLFAALSPSPPPTTTTATTPAHLTGTPTHNKLPRSTTTRAVPPSASRASPAPAPLSAISLLDGDGEDMGGHASAQWDAVLSPERPKVVVSPTPNTANYDSKSVSDDSEEWNW